jgi:hypothetical protein
MQLRHVAKYATRTTGMKDRKSKIVDAEWVGQTAVDLLEDAKAEPKIDVQVCAKLLDLILKTLPKTSGQTGKRVDPALEQDLAEARRVALARSRDAAALRSSQEPEPEPE